MLSKHRCPHTGVVNFFTITDPFVSVGSIIKSGERSEKYHWRLYDAARSISGIAADMRSAEERLKRRFKERAENEPAG